MSINPNAISINAGFEVGSKQAIDARFVMTKAQMLAVSDAVMPDIYPTWCPDDGKNYIYTKTNEVDPVTGKFRLVTTDLSNCLTKVSTMPTITPTMADADKMVVYNGADETTYKKGHIYVVGNVAESTALYKVDNGTEIMYVATNTLTDGMTAYVGAGTEVSPAVATTVHYDEDSTKFYPGDTKTADNLFADTDIASETSDIYVEGQVWVDVNDTSSLENEIKKRLEKVPSMPTASATTVGEFVLYTGASTVDYVTGHIYKGITDGGDPATYSWVDISPDNFQFTTMPTASELQGRVVQYIGETTTVAPIYIKGHFYQSTETATDVWSWVEMDTEIDDYDHIENRPLILTRAEELFNDTVELVGTSSDVTDVENLDFQLVLGASYTISINGTEETVVAQGTSADASIASADGSVIFYNFGSTVTLSIDNSYFSENPTIILTKEASVDVNPDYQDFFNTIGAESKLSEGVRANVDVGGITNGQLLAKDTVFTDVVKALLHKYYAPTISTSSAKPLLNELGTTIANPIRIGAQALDGSEEILTMSISLNGVELVSSAGPIVQYDYETDISSDTTFVFTATDTKRANTKDMKFEFINPFFYGNSDVDSTEIADFTGLTKLLEKKGTKTLAYTAAAKYLVFAYDKTYGALTSIKDGNNFENLPAFDRVELSVDDPAGTSHDYYVYVSHDKVTCSAFSYTFKF